MELGGQNSSPLPSQAPDAVKLLLVGESGSSMPNLIISIPHGLSQREVLKRMKYALTQAKAQHSGKIKDLQEKWSGNIGRFSGSAMGHAASGTITVNASEIVFDLALPFAATFFKGKVEAGIRKFAATLLT
jgi:hypothetical protein